MNFTVSPPSACPILCISMFQKAAFETIIPETEFIATVDR